MKSAHFAKNVYHCQQYGMWPAHERCNRLISYRSSRPEITDNFKTLFGIFKSLFLNNRRKPLLVILKRFMPILKYTVEERTATSTNADPSPDFRTLMVKIMRDKDKLEYKDFERLTVPEFEMALVRGFSLGKYHYSPSNTLVKTIWDNGPTSDIVTLLPIDEANLLTIAEHVLDPECIIACTDSFEDTVSVGLIRPWMDYKKDYDYKRVLVVEAMAYVIKKTSRFRSRPQDAALKTLPPNAPHRARIVRSAVYEDWRLHRNRLDSAVVGAGNVLGIDIADMCWWYAGRIFDESEKRLSRFFINVNKQRQVEVIDFVTTEKLMAFQALCGKFPNAELQGSVYLFGDGSDLDIYVNAVDELEKVRRQTTETLHGMGVEFVETRVQGYPLFSFTHKDVNVDLLVCDDAKRREIERVKTVFKNTVDKGGASLTSSILHVRGFFSAAQLRCFVLGMFSSPAVNVLALHLPPHRKDDATRRLLDRHILQPWRSSALLGRQLHIGIDTISMRKTRGVVRNYRLWHFYDGADRYPSDILIARGSQTDAWTCLHEGLNMPMSEEVLSELDAIERALRSASRSRSIYSVPSPCPHFSRWCETWSGNTIGVSVDGSVFVPDVQTPSLPPIIEAEGYIFNRTMTRATWMAFVHTIQGDLQNAVDMKLPFDFSIPILLQQLRTWSYESTVEFVFPRFISGRIHVLFREHQSRPIVQKFLADLAGA